MDATSAKTMANLQAKIEPHSSHFGSATINVRKVCQEH